jgi:cytochrome P450
MLSLARWESAPSMLRTRRAVATAAQELIRFDSPFQAQSRMCTSDTDLAGRSISRGDTVTMLLSAGNRDPARFHKPDKLILSRYPNHHLGFGRGVHTCLGASVALSMLHSLLALISETGAAISLSSTPEFDQNPTLRGLIRLPVHVFKP